VACSSRPNNAPSGVESLRRWLGPGTSFVDKVTKAQAFYLIKDLAATCAVLGDLESQISAQAGKKQLSYAEALKLSLDVNEIWEAIECN